MSAPPDTATARSAAPVLGFVFFGGSLSGALVRDVRLANECAARGYPVHVWWAMDWQHHAGLRSEIQQHWLFSGLRFWSRGFGRGALDRLGRTLNRCFDDKARAHGLQKRPRIMTRLMNSITRALCEGVEHDRAIVQRFARDLRNHRVTHVLPMLEMLCLWVNAARAHIPASPPKLLVTFQGYELYSTYARWLGLEDALYRQLAEAVNRSDFPAIAVSEDYRHRVREELDVPLEKMVAIPPGVPAAKRMEPVQAREVLRTKFKEYSPDPDLPLIAFLGRRDTEKGIDLLLYATKILAQRGKRFQLAICGPTLWGDHYGEVCRKIAEELRIHVMWRRFVPDDVRSALFSLAHCIVYPSIHREPFGMVAAEAAAHGAPAIVPDYGGVASAIEADGEAAGLRFRAWDSGDLATQIERVLEDRALHARLSEAGPRVAAYYSISKLADRVLAHIGLPARV